MKNQRGFSLVELVIVIIVVGLLAATALPRFLQVTDEAKKASIEASLVVLLRQFCLLVPSGKPMAVLSIAVANIRWTTMAPTFADQGNNR